MYFSIHNLLKYKAYKQSKLKYYFIFLKVYLSYHFSFITEYKNELLVNKLSFIFTYLTKHF